MRAAGLYLGVWALASLLLPLKQHLLPDCFATFSACYALAVRGSLMTDLGVTLLRTAAGVGGALVLGGVIGLGMGSTRAYREFIAPALDFVRGIPVAMLFPLFVLLAGIGEMSRFLMVLTLATPILIVSIASGVDDVASQQDLRLWMVLHKSRLPRWLPIFSLAWRMMPGIVSGVKAAISLGLVMVVVSEMLFVAKAGVGYAAYQAYNAFEMSDMYAYVFITGLVGYLLNSAFDCLAATFASSNQGSLRRAHDHGAKQDESHSPK